MTSPEAIVQRQLEAYNARDLERFVACYGDDVRVYRPPATEPAIEGKAALAEFYSTQRFNRPGLKAEIVDRMVLGNKVIDHERVFGVQPAPMDVAAIYEVTPAGISRVWFVSGDQGGPARSATAAIDTPAAGRYGAPAARIG